MRNLNCYLLKKIHFALLIISCFYISSCKDSIEKDFIEVTGQNLPKEAKIIFQEETPVDFHGDFGSVSKIKVKSIFYKHLQNKLLEKGFIQDTIGPRLSEFKTALNQINTEKIKYNYKFEKSNLYYYVGLQTDNETIIVVRSSW